MIDKAIDRSITKASLKNLRISHGEYDWTDAGVFKSNYGSIMLLLLFKSINPATRIGDSKLKY